MKIRVFSAPSESELEVKVNEWLGSFSRIDIVKMTQSEAGDAQRSLTLTFLYDSADQGPQKTIGLGS